MFETLLELMREQIPSQTIHNSNVVLLLGIPRLANRDIKTIIAPDPAAVAAGNHADVAPSHGGAPSWQLQ